MKRPRLLPLALFATALLPSCVQWNLGENIRTASTTYLDLDYRHPVDGKVYRLTERDGRHRHFARLPEVRYHKMPALISLDLYGDKDYDASVVEATGRSALMELEVSVFSREGTEVKAPCLHGYLHEVKALPAGAVELPWRDYCYNARQMMGAGQAEAGSGPGPTRRALAATLSHSLDPLLTVVSTTAYWGVMIPVELISAPFFCIVAQSADLYHVSSEPAAPQQHTP